MIQLNRYLLIGLAVQALLAATLLISSNSHQDMPTKPYLDIDFAAVDAVTIKGEKETVELIRDHDSNIWRQPNYGNLNVPSKKMSDFFDSLKKVTVRWPVATQANAAERFEVADNSAQKTLEFKSGDKILTTLYLGTSPGMRKVHARINNDKNIYAIDFSQHQASNQAMEWFDKNILAVTDTIKNVTTEGFELSHDDDDWHLLNIENNQTSNKSAIDDWVEKIRKLNVARLITDKTLAEKILVQNPVQTLHVQLAKGEVDFAFYKQDEDYYIKRFGDEKLFAIHNYQATPLVTVDTKQFITEAAENTMTNNKENSQITLPTNPVTPK